MRAHRAWNSHLLVRRVGHHAQLIRSHPAIDAFVPLDAFQLLRERILNNRRLAADPQSGKPAGQNGRINRMLLRQLDHDAL